MTEFPLPESILPIINRYPQLGEVVRFGYELLTELKKVHPDLDLTGLKLTPELVEMKLKEGLPLLKKSEINLHSGQFQKVFVTIAHFVAEKRPALKPEVTELVKKAESQELDVQKLANQSLSQEKGKKECGSILQFLVRISLKPFGLAYGSALSSYIHSHEELWEQPYCPLCGSDPSLSYITGDEGRRYLLCSWCGTSWIFRRIKCPYCQNADQKKLTYFTLDDGKEIAEKDRISICKECRKYIKTLDMRKKEVVDLEKADIATLHLDLLAEREGYERIPGPLFFF